MIKFLMENGANINAIFYVRNEDGNFTSATSLYICAVSGNFLILIMMFINFDNFFQ